MRCVYTAVAASRDDHVFQGLRDETYKPGDTLRVASETWRVDEVHDLLTMSRDPKTRALQRTLYCTVV